MDATKEDKLIAEFMGLKPRWVEYPDKALSRWEVDKNRTWQQMQFHTSWDWLMPVVEKLAEIGFPYEMKENFCGFKIYGHWKWGSGKTLQEAVYRAVVETIAFYNTNK